MLRRKTPLRAGKPPTTHPEPGTRASGRPKADYGSFLGVPKPPPKPKAAPRSLKPSRGAFYDDDDWPWAEVKLLVQARDGRCMSCGLQGTWPPHHVTSVKALQGHENPVLRAFKNHPANLLMFCKRCHDQWHAGHLWSKYETYVVLEHRYAYPYGGVCDGQALPTLDQLGAVVEDGGDGGDGGDGSE